LGVKERERESGFFRYWIVGNAVVSEELFYSITSTLFNNNNTNTQRQTMVSTFKGVGVRGSKQLV